MGKVFVSYSHLDEAWKTRVVKQLAVLKGEGLIVWDDRMIGVGGDWEREIEVAIGACDVALLLISADFLTSEYIDGKEVPPLLQRREKEGIRVIPVILRPCEWRRIGWLKAINARPKDGEALSGMSDHDAEAALSKLAGEVADYLATHKQLTPSKPAQPAGKPQDESSAGAETSATCLQRELDHHLKLAWTEADMAAFVALFKPGMNRKDYSAVVSNSANAYGDLRDLDIALGKLPTTPPHLLGLDVSNAIALSALVLYAKYNAAPLGNAAVEICAANLLFAAVQATTRHGADLGVRQTDARDREVSSAMISPRTFNAFVKDGEKDPEWEQIKRSLWLSADALLSSTKNISHKAIHQGFRERAPNVAERNPRIADQEVISDLARAEKELGSRFVYFVNQRHEHERAMAERHRERLEQTFGVKTVIWREDVEAHGAAWLIESIFEKLFKITQLSLPAIDEEASPLTGTNKTTRTLDAATTGLKKLNETADQGNKLLETGGKLFGALANVWNVTKNLLP